MENNLLKNFNSTDLNFSSPTNKFSAIQNRNFHESDFTANPKFENSVNELIKRDSKIHKAYDSILSKFKINHIKNKSILKLNKNKFPNDKNIYPYKIYIHDEVLDLNIKIIEAYLSALQFIGIECLHSDNSNNNDSSYRNKISKILFKKPNGGNKKKSLAFESNKLTEGIKRTDLIRAPDPQAAVDEVKVRKSRLYQGTLVKSKGNKTHKIEVTKSSTLKDLLDSQIKLTLKNKWFNFNCEKNKAQELKTAEIKNINNHNSVRNTNSTSNIEYSSDYHNTTEKNLITEKDKDIDRNNEKDNSDYNYNTTILSKTNYKNNYKHSQNDSNIFNNISTLQNNYLPDDLSSSIKNMFGKSTKYHSNKSENIGKPQDQAFENYNLPLANKYNPIINSISKDISKYDNEEEMKNLVTIDYNKPRKFYLLRNFLFGLIFMTINICIGIILFVTTAYNGIQEFTTIKNSIINRNSLLFDSFYFLKITLVDMRMPIYDIYKNKTNYNIFDLSILRLENSIKSVKSYENAGIFEKYHMQLIRFLDNSFNSDFFCEYFVYFSNETNIEAIMSLKDKKLPNIQSESLQQLKNTSSNFKTATDNCASKTGNLFKKGLVEFLYSARYILVNMVNDFKYYEELLNQTNATSNNQLIINQITSVLSNSTLYKSLISDIFSSEDMQILNYSLKNILFDLDQIYLKIIEKSEADYIESLNLTHGLCNYLLLSIIQIIFLLYNVILILLIYIPNNIIDNAEKIVKNSLFYRLD